jgi:type II restriction/modification system DNA methylase subunit YeeA
MKVWIGLFLFIGVFSSGNAQQLTSSEMIKNTLETFTNAWASSDTTELSKVLHPNFKLRFINNSELVETKKRFLLNRMGPKQARDSKVTLSILSSDIMGNLAHSKVKIKSPQATFNDYFILAYTNQKWLITDRFSYIVDNK